MQPTAQIITIGDELLLGQVVDTNSAFIGQKAAEAGLRIESILSVSDRSEAIKSAIANALNCVDIVIVTGGLGPTKDDITKRAIAELFALGLVRDQTTYLFVKEMLAARSVEFNELNESQADIPEGFTALCNEVGTAPGLFYNHNGKLLFCLPGVPFEMKKLLTEQLLPIVGQHFELNSVVQRTILLFGVAESELAQRIAPWEDALPEYLSLAYLPNPNGIRLRLTSRSTSLSNEDVRQQIDQQFSALRPLIEDFYLGDYPTSVPEELAKLLRARHATLSTAESCTGGAISALCTQIEGASQWFKGGVIAYDNRVKISSLSVDQSDIEKYGAVSEEVVRAMAKGVCRATGSDFSIATSGIAGPDGGSSEKPVGTIWIAVCNGARTSAFRRNFGQPRNVFIDRASAAALNYLRLAMLRDEL